MVLVPANRLIFLISEKLSKTFLKVLQDIASKFHYCNQNPQNIHTSTNSRLLKQASPIFSKYFQAHLDKGQQN